MPFCREKDMRRDVSIAAIVAAMIMPAGTIEIAHAQAAPTVPPTAAQAPQGTEPSDQQTQPSSPQTQQPANGVEDVVVTAQRREESAQSVPISVAAFSSDTLNRRGAASIADLPTLVAGVTLQATGSSQPIFLRGVGNSGLGTGGAAVLTFIDGIYQPFNQGSTVFNNLTSIEVDKGPQGTLFGRNATGGIVQITTRKPGFEPTASVSLSYANYDTFTGQGYASTGLTSAIATDLAVYFQNQQDGWGTNLATGKDVFKSRDFAIRNRTLFNLSENTTAQLFLDYRTSRGSIGSSSGSSIPGGGQLFNYLVGQSFPVPLYDVATDVEPAFRTREGGAALKVETDFGPFRGLSITSYRKNHVELEIDYDGTLINFFEIRRRDTSNAFTQELQLLSPDTSPIKYVVGAFYYHLGSTLKPFGFYGAGATAVFGAPPGQNLGIYADSRVSSYAVFGQATATILPETRLTLGARYTIDKTSIDGFTRVGPTLIPGSSGTASTTTKRPTFRVILEHSFSKDILAYASFNTGYNAGGFNLVSPAGFANASAAAIRPETIKAYEVGVKSEVLDHKLRVNGAVFHYDYSNLQQQIFSNGGVFTVNAAAARITGVDLDLQARPVHNLTLSGGMEYLDSKFTSYPGAAIYTLLPNRLLSTSAGDVAGNRTPNAPKFSYNLASTLTIPSRIGTFATTANAAYTGAFFGDASNHFREPGHWLVNLTQSLTLPDSKTEVSVWAKNVTNRYYDVSLTFLDLVGAIGAPGAPRTFGGTVTRRF